MSRRVAREVVVTHRQPATVAAGRRTRAVSGAEVPVDGGMPAHGGVTSLSDAVAVTPH